MASRTGILAKSATWAWSRGKEPTSRAESSLTVIFGLRPTMVRLGILENIICWFPISRLGSLNPGRLSYPERLSIERYCVVFGLGPRSST